MHSILIIMTFVFAQGLVDLTEFLFFNLFENDPRIPITLSGHFGDHFISLQWVNTSIK